MTLTTYQKGHWAEWISLLYMRLKGYRLLTKRFNSTGRKTGAGEIDLVLQKGKMIVFCEIKYRRTLNEALESIRPAQQKRIRRGAELFLKRFRKYNGFDIRFDVIALAKHKFPIHLKNAF